MTNCNSTCLWQINEPRAEYGAFQQVKTTTVKPKTTPTKTVPSVTLSGQWLEKAGFTIGTSVEIVVVENGIQLNIENED